MSVSSDIAGDDASQLSAAVLGNAKIEVFNEIPIKEMRADSLTKLDPARSSHRTRSQVMLPRPKRLLGTRTARDARLFGPVRRRPAR